MCYCEQNIESKSEPSHEINIKFVLTDEEYYIFDTYFNHSRISSPIKFDDPDLKLVTLTRGAKNKSYKDRNRIVDMVAFLLNGEIDIYPSFKPSSNGTFEDMGY